VNEPSQAARTASRSSFYKGMRILPRAQREAMFEIYSFCRAVDDIADDFGPRESRREQLAGRRRRRWPAWRWRCARSICGAKTSSLSSTAWRWM
jgi:phytoene/squalene synthetase